MTKDVDALNIYLEQARVNAAGGDAVAIVIGSEAADLDSMVSALLYGLLASAAVAPGAPPIVPVVNCPRGDFPLRTEAAYLFAAVGVDVNALLFVDEIDLEALHRAGRLRLILVDHNILSAAHEKFADAVDAIIDHHPDGGLYAQAQPRRIEPVGSATTLVAEAMLCEKPALIGAGLATLMLGTILLDTVNLDPAAQRVTAKDREIAVQLGEASSLAAGELFETLEAEKFNVSALSTPDLLRKDYKAWGTPSLTYGISTVMTSIQDWSAKDSSLVAGMETFLRSRGLACLLAMMAYTDAGRTFHRELVVYAPDPLLAAELAAMLEASDLGLSRARPVGLVDSGKVKMYTQLNTSISRKKLQPLLDCFFSVIKNTCPS